MLKNVLLIVAFLLVSTCFALETRIYGGKLVEDPKIYPFFVQLYDLSKGKNYNFCGGSMIGPLHILTATHCFKLGITLENLEVGAGALDVRSEQIEKMQPKSFDYHKDFIFDTFANDVAVVKLERPFKKSTGVRSIELTDTDPEVGSKIVSVGYGETDDGTYPYKMKYVNLHVVGFEECKAFSDIYKIVRDRQHMCAWDEDKSSCHGDSGGPLFTGEYEKATQYGIVSFGAECGTVPTVYARVNFFKDWIKKHTTYNVCYSTTAASASTTYLKMCAQVGGTVTLTTDKICCEDLNVYKIRAIDMTWNDCTGKMEKDLCEKVGRFSCSGTTAKCRLF